MGGGQVSSEIKDVYPRPIEKWTVDVSYKNIDRLIGNKIAPEIIKEILVDLGIEIQSEKDEGLRLLIPTNKVDVTREADIIEEIVRIFGFNNIKVEGKIAASVQIRQKPDSEFLQNRISEQLTAQGFNEIMNNSLTNSDYYQKQDAFDEQQHVRLFNALSTDLDIMRQTLLFGGLEVIAYNRNRKVSDIKIYEFGNIYQKLPGKEGLKQYNEEKHLAIFSTGQVMPENWNSDQDKAGFFYLKGITENILERLGIPVADLEISVYDTPIYGESIAYSVRGGKLLAEVASISQHILDIFDIRDDVYTSVLYWDALLKMVPKKDMTYKPVSKFPAVRRDLALLINSDVQFGDLKAAALKAERKLLKSVGIFDIYEGDKIPSGKKSYALSFTLQDEDKTLTDKVIDKTMRRIQQVLEQEFNAELR